MSVEAPVAIAVPTRRGNLARRSGMGMLLLLFAGMALLTPFTRADPHGRLGVLLILAAVMEIAHGLRRSDASAGRQAWWHGTLSLIMGVVLINAPLLAGSALMIMLAGSLLIDGVRSLSRTFRATGTRQRSMLVNILGGLIYCLIATVLITSRGELGDVVVAIATAARIFATAAHVIHEPVFSTSDAESTVVDDLGLAESEELSSLAGEMVRAEAARIAADRGWILGFVATLFAIHITRIGFDRSFLGIVSPGFAVVGDLFIALVLAFVLVIPAQMLLRRLTWRLERAGWQWYLAAPADRRGWIRWAVYPALAYNLRCAIRLRQARYSLRTAVGRGLQLGLPLAAIIAATAPVFGMSWYFDTENWAASIWNSWAEERTDTWREAMARAVLANQPATDPARAFAVFPPGITGGSDFSFIVIGDTGEGDASQHSLRAAYLDAVQQQRVKFVVLSSDVVYSTGAMKNYEAGFWLPFMGTTKPMYAIPGNHDWYDALEAFSATFLEPSAARLAIRARIEADLRLTSTTDAQIERLIQQATLYRQEYGVPTQHQAAPFFQIQTDSFALMAIDTGVARRLDPVQLEWLRNALESARGKMKMAILGHPLYAAGHYTAEEESEFAALHALLRKHEVAIVMAGDTHDLEYYHEPLAGGRSIRHFVNGGGGAYLSYGTSLDWPDRPATSEWAFFPSTERVVSKIESSTPWWKKPAWWWTKQAGAWPFSTEFLAAAFDSNTAPFYQSFVEVRVEPSERRLVVVPHGVRGPLRWSDLQASTKLQSSRHPDALVEWIIPVSP